MNRHIRLIGFRVLERILHFELLFKLQINQDRSQKYYLFPRYNTSTEYMMSNKFIYKSVGKRRQAIRQSARKVQ